MPQRPKNGSENSLNFDTLTPQELESEAKELALRGNAVALERCLEHIWGLPQFSGLEPSLITGVLLGLIKSDCSKIKKILDLLVPNQPLDDKFIASIIIKALNKEKWSRGRKYKSFPEQILKWTNYILSYSLCPKTELKCLFDPLLETVRSKPALVPQIADLLIGLIDEKSEVKPYRVILTHELLLSMNQNSRAQVKSGLTNLMDKFHFIAPELTPGSWKLRKTSHLHDILDSGDAMSQNFDQVWKERSPEKLQLDQLFSDAGLTWKCEDVFTNEAFHHQPKPKRRKLTQVLPLPTENPLKTETKGRKTLLSQCKTVGEILNNLERITTPSQTMTLMNNRGTFFLLLCEPKESHAFQKLSCLIYHTLHQEFFSGVHRPDRFERQRFILKRIGLLQDFFMEGIPVVARFLSEFLAEWNGKDFFLEILSLLSYIQLTDFEELQECILSPLVHHFHMTFCNIERLLFLVYVNKLVLHWISSEYSRVLRSEAHLFGTANDNCRTPLAELNNLLTTWCKLCNVGLFKLLKSPRTPTVDKVMFMDEVLHMFSLTSRMLVVHEVPITLEIPASFVYLSIFDSTPIFLSRVLDHLALVKHESFPLCRKILATKRGTSRVDKEAEAEVIRGAIKSGEDGFGQLTCDLVAILSNYERSLSSNSLFRKSWRVDEDFILSSLCVTNHLAFLPVLLRFLHKFGDGLDGESYERVLERLDNPNTSVNEEYIAYLSKFYPRIIGFLDTFKPPQARGPALVATIPSDTRSIRSADVSSVGSSGISSMQPTVRRSARKRK